MRTARDGFTLLELLIALVLASLMIGATLTFFGSQIRVFEVASQHSSLLQSSQSAARILARDIRTAGTNVLPHQPWLVYAGPDVIAFHADYVSSVPDAFAVYVEPHIPAGLTRSLTKQERITIPQTTFSYPDTTYWSAPGIPGAAELLIFFFAPDETSGTADDFVLYRQVNGGAPEAVARRIVRSDTMPFFQYFRPVAGSGGHPVLTQVPAAQLPLRHDAPLHLSPADTGRFAVIDSVRAVRFNFTMGNGRTGADERRMSRSRMVWLRNAALASRTTCGSTPIFGSVVSARFALQDDIPVVELEWAAATDETGGEKDVIRYVIWRHAPGAPLGDPYLSVPAGAPPYSYTDAVQSGDSWHYTIAAQDCTPALSVPVSVGPIIIP
jgi:prepilin-type N-terminal cleavage/methylation domain-containing protein